MIKIVLSPLNTHNCSNCDVSICKRKAVEDINNTRNLKGIVYNKLVFIGDGYNDFCACLALNSVQNSIVYCRKNYALYRMLFESKDKKLNRSSINSDVIVWETGYDIVDHLKSVIQN
jgi:histidinol-phosphate/aromatic aminotransferase/cobyric acid decarboxylase-like protein